MVEVPVEVLESMRESFVPVVTCWLPVGWKLCSDCLAAKLVVSYFVPFTQYGLFFQSIDGKTELVVLTPAVVGAKGSCSRSKRLPKDPVRFLFVTGLYQALIPAK